MASAKPNLGESIPQLSCGNRLINLAGKTIGRLTVLKFVEIHKTPKGRQYFWLCRCECGTKKLIDGCCLRRRSTLSCGCMSRENTTTHGMTNHQLYDVWQGIKQRCLNPKSDCYQHYGGRGVTICDRWRDSFKAFYSDMGERPTSMHTIERIDNDRGYEPGNCRWATRAEQNENTRQTRLLTFGGLTLSIGKWARRIGIARKTLLSRIDRLGWSIERALSTSPRPMKRKRQ